MTNYSIKHRLLKGDSMKNLCGKTRKVDNPYEVWQSLDGSWKWKVLKKYQSPDNEAKNPYARWFCAVSSPMTGGSYDLGDVYIKDIVNYAKLVSGPMDMRPVMRQEVDARNVC